MFSAVPTMGADGGHGETYAATKLKRPDRLCPPCKLRGSLSGAIQRAPERSAMIKLTEITDFSELLRYLREFRNCNDDPYAYDPGAVIALLLSLLDNFRQFAMEGDIDELGYRFTDEQRAFLKKLAENANKITDKEIEAGDD
jgi:hypothetical protein